MLDISPTIEDETEITSDAKKNDAEKVANIAAKTVYKCEICPATYHKHGLLINHKRKKHGIDELVLLECDQCDSSYDTVKKLNRHKRDVHRE